MSFQERENSGALFKNERKEKETHPDYKGTCLVGGVQYEIGAWVKEAKNGGKKYFSLSFKAKEDRAGYNGPQQTPPLDQFGEALPF